METALGRRLPLRPDAYSRKRAAASRGGLPLHGLPNYGRQRLFNDAWLSRAQALTLPPAIP
jgi:hypothetical protein